MPCEAAEGACNGKPWQKAAILLIHVGPGHQIGGGKRGKVALRSFFFNSRVQGAAAP